MVNEMNDENFLWWFGHIERMGKDSITKREYDRECMELVKGIDRGKGGLFQ